MRTSFLIIALFLGTASHLNGQIVGTVPSPYESIEQNSISNMEAFGDTLWIGPGLNRNIGNEPDWFYPADADSITTGPGRLFSLGLARDTVFAGLGYNFASADGSTQTGLGYHLSTDGGDSWSFLSLPLDAEDDTTVVYGGESYRMLPITVPQQSPPFEITMKGKAVFTANWASGVLRSTDFGASWQRMILPPQSADSLVPEQSYEFSSNRYDPRADQNFLGFSVLVDHNKNVWAGTAGGVNISPNALTAPQDSVRWRHLQAGNEGELLGNWVVTIVQQPTTDDIWMTNWASGISQNEQFGIIRTTDGGQSFDQYLVGQKINDIGFLDSHIFAAGDDGLFLSPDNGNSWQQITQIQSPENFIKSSAQYYSVATTDNRVWIGTSDGLASTADLGQSWEITRVNFPLSGGNQYQPNAPNVETFAYPNPFSPSRNDLVRIKFDVQQQGNVTIRVLDFGMNLIRELENESFAPGTYEAAWNGRDRNGNIVANGPVFYQVETPGNVARGKILILD